MKIILKSDLNELKRLTSFLDNVQAKWPFSDSLKQKIDIVFDEIVSNIIIHGYQNYPGGDIEVEFSYSNNCLELVIQDNALEFNPLAHSDPDITLPLEEREIGNLGIFITKKIMDEVSYKRVNDKNILTLKKWLS